MSKSFKRVLGLLVIVLLVFASLHTVAQDDVTLLVWDQHGGPADGAANTLYERFMEMHPHITIERDVFTGADLNTLVPTAMAGGTGPDLAYYDISEARSVFRAGLFQPLDSFADAYGWRERFFPAGLQWSIIDGLIAALGLEYEFVGVFVNDTLFEQEGLEVPTTLDETLAFCEAAAELGYVPFAHGQNPGWQAYFSFTMPLHNMVGVEFMENLLFNNEGSWTDDDIVRAVEIVTRDMRDAGCFLDDVNGLDWQGQQELFFSGEAMLFPTGTWVVGEILESTEGTFEVSMVPFPAIEEGGDRIYTTGMGSAYFMSAATEHAEEAAMLLDFLFSQEAGEVWIDVAGFIPPVPVDTSNLELQPLKAFVLETLELAGTGQGDTQLGYNVDLVAPAEFNTMMREGFQAVMAGDKAALEQLEDLQALWDAG